MGRGTRSQASTANQLLYGQRKRGSGPRSLPPIGSFAHFREGLLRGHFTLDHHLLPREEVGVVGGREGQGVDCEYVTATVDHIWIEPAEVTAFQNNEEQWLLINYSNDGDPETDYPISGTHREMAFFKTLSQTIDNDMTVDFAFSNDSQLSGFIVAYGIEDVNFSGVGSHGPGQKPTQQMIIKQVMDDNYLKGDQLEIFDSAQSFAEIWLDPDGQVQLEDLADRGELCLSLPLRAFANNSL